MARVRVTGAGPCGDAGAAWRRRDASSAIGIIGGSGLYELEGVDRRALDAGAHAVRRSVRRVLHGHASATGRVIFLPRHGRGHRLTPTELNFRANIWGLKSLGAEWVVSVSAVGSMKETIHPLDLVIPDQFFDATQAARVRRSSATASSAHVGMADPVCPTLADALEKAARAAGATVHRGGTYICIEGPQFSTQGRVAHLPRAGAST